MKIRVGIAYINSTYFFTSESQVLTFFNPNLSNTSKIYRLWDIHFSGPEIWSRSMSRNYTKESVSERASEREVEGDRVKGVNHVI